MSPSIRREWIEMFQGHELDKEHLGLPPYGGSGLKWRCVARTIRAVSGLPPYGGSGLKFTLHSILTITAWSPSIRREWIEMHRCYAIIARDASPSIRREWIEIPDFHSRNTEDASSPSIRREWIEILVSTLPLNRVKVSLHTEGVD